MSRLKKASAAAVVAGAIVFGSVAPANAIVTTCPGVGGTWDYGVTNIVWSKFLSNKLHRSTAGNSLGDWRSANTQPGRWASVSISATAFNNRAYCANI